MSRRAWIVFALLALAACREEDRRAWVSILPGREEERAAPAGGPLALAADSTAVLLGADTLFTLRRVPARVSGGRAFARLAMAPDSASVAVELAGPTPAVLIWSRDRQTMTLAGAFAGGSVTSFTWSPDGRLLAFDGRDAEGVSRAGLFDAVEARPGRQPVVQWLTRQRRSVRFQDWPTPRHARFLVSPGVAPEGGLAYLWDIERGAFLLESHAAAVAENAPAGTPVPGGVFSLDMTGDGAPETVILYRAVSGAPAARVVVDAGPGGVRVVTSEPLVANEAVGIENWEVTGSGPGLYQIAEIGGRPTLLLVVPAASPYPLIGLFQAALDGRLAPVTVASASGGGAPALFADGSVGQETRQLGIADLDGDGSPEVVAAYGRGDPVLSGGWSWSAEVYRWEGGRLVGTPDLEAAAVERLRRMVEGG